MADVLPARWMRAASRVLAPRYRSEILADLAEERESMRAKGHGRIASAMWMLGHLGRSAFASRVRHRVPPSGQMSPRDNRGGPSLGRELRQAARSLRKTPWYAGTIIAVTALSMALATTIFAIVDGVLFKPLPYPNPDELYAVSGVLDEASPVTGRRVRMVSQNEVTAWSDMLTDTPVTGLLYSGIGLPDGTFAYGVAVDRSFFEVFGVRLLMGGFRDEHYGVKPPIWPVIISHRLWQEKFGGDPAVLGTMLPAGFLQPPVQIVGVLAPEGFVPPLPGSSPAASRRENRIDVVKTLTDPSSSERAMVAFARVPTDRLAATQANFTRAVRAYRDASPPLPADLSPEARQFQTPYDDVAFVPLREYTSARERPAFAVAFGSVMSLVCLVLLNAGALSAARAHQRLRELSLRRALGARTRDLLRHALAEQSILVALGAAAGVVVAPMMLALVLDRLPPGLNLIKDPRIDWRVLLFAGFVSALTAIAVALLSVRVAVRRATWRAEPSGSASVVGSPNSTNRVYAGRLLLAAQTAVAFALILGGALFTASLARLWTEDPGMELRDLAMMTVTYSDRALIGSGGRARGLDLAVRLRATPGVTGAAVHDTLVMQNLSRGGSAFQPPDGIPADVPEPTSVSVGSDFFQTTGVELVSGRLPSDAELDTGAPVIAVSESLARAYWPGRSAIGQILRSRTRNVVVQVVGVVRDVRLVALDVPADGVIFAPWSLPIRYYSGPRLIVRLAGGADTLPAITERIRQLDPQARLRDVQMLEDAASESIRERRLSAFAASTFAAIALVFVAIGILGLVAMTASRRTREVGIRVALGARPGGVVRQLIGEQLGAVIAGTLAGGLIAAWGVRFVQAHLYETTAYDPAVWMTTVGVMLVTTMFGAWIPARRASRVDPVEALREN
jgi:putative ABC transport system permease protein